MSDPRMPDLVLICGEPSLSAPRGESSTLIATQSPPVDAPRIPNFNAQLGRTLAVLIVVVALALLVGRFVRRFGGGRPRGCVDGTSLSVMGTVRLGPRQQVHLVRAANQVIVVGTWPEGMTALAVCAASADDGPAAAAPSDQRESLNFLRRLGRVAGPATQGGES